MPAVVAVDDFSPNATGLSDPPRNVLPVTPSDADELAHVSRAISWGTDGDITYVDASGRTGTLPAGSLAPLMQHSMRLRKILSTGTTAEQITVYW